MQRRRAAARVVGGEPAARVPNAAGAATGIRARIERTSAPMLLFLHRLPVWAPVAVLLAVFLVGLFSGGVLGVACLAVVLLVLVWLTVLAWPRLSRSDRIFRSGALTALAVAMVLQLTR
jgi:hypothetical protein